MSETKRQELPAWVLKKERIYAWLMEGDGIQKAIRKATEEAGS